MSGQLRKFVSKSKLYFLLPQWLVLPSMGEAHSCGLNGWIFGKKRINLSLHVILRRYDIQKILDDAKTEIGFLLVDRNSNPRLCQSPHRQYLQRKCAIPYTGMVTTIIAGNRYDSHPRVKDGDT